MMEILQVSNGDTFGFQLQDSCFFVSHERNKYFA